MVDFADDSALTKQGANLYSTGQTPNTPATVNIRQGALEASNVQPVIEISHMIEVMRAYEATATLSKSQEDLMRQAIDKLGQMPELRRTDQCALFPSPRPACWPSRPMSKSSPTIWRT